MKTRLGISVGMAAAATYFAAIFGGYTVLTLSYTKCAENCRENHNDNSQTEEHCDRIR